MSRLYVLDFQGKYVCCRGGKRPTCCSVSCASLVTARSVLSHNPVVKGEKRRGQSDLSQEEDDLRWLANTLSPLSLERTWTGSQELVQYRMSTDHNGAFEAAVFE